MSNKQNDKIIDDLLDQYQELGGNIKKLYERNDFSHMSLDKIIGTLQREIDALDDNPDDYSPDNPLGGTAEPYDIEREK